MMMSYFGTLLLVALFSIESFALTVTSKSTTISVIIPPPIPAPIANLQPGNWLELPNTKIRSISSYPDVNVVIPWSGGTVDSKRNRLLIWGGGHNDYFGNEIYALELSTLKMTQLNQSTAKQCSNTTIPESRHTYDGLAYIAHADKFFSIGGALSCAGNGDKNGWLFDFITKLWTKVPNAPYASDGYGAMAEYDPITKLVFYNDTNKFYTYNYDTNTYATLSTAFSPYYTSMAIDWKRRKAVILGDGVKVYNLDTKQYSAMTTTNTPSLVTQGAPGIAYDSAADRIVAWTGGSNVYALNMDTGAWSQVATGTGPTFTQSVNAGGTFGRWGYVPQYKVHVIVNSVDQNAWVFKLSN